MLKRLEFADPKYLVVAVMDIHDDFQRDGQKPGSEHWTTDTRYYRPTMCDAVCQRWCELTGRDTADFPFHQDFVVQVWVMFRKESESNKVALRRKAITLTN